MGATTFVPGHLTIIRVPKRSLLAGRLVTRLRLYGSCLKVPNQASWHPSLTRYRTECGAEDNSLGNGQQNFEVGSIVLKKAMTELPGHWTDVRHSIGKEELSVALALALHEDGMTELSAGVPRRRNGLVKYGTHEEVE